MAVRFPYSNAHPAASAHTYTDRSPCFVLPQCDQTDARYAFIVDWYDATACMVRQYQLMYYCADGTIEMVRLAGPQLWAHVACFGERRTLTSALPPAPVQFDLKNRRTFLKRCDYPSVRLADLYEGSIITVYSRQLTIVKYGDTFTARAFQKQTEMCARRPLAAPAPSSLAFAHPKSMLSGRTPIPVLGAPAGRLRT